jgi:glycosyltransferase involved in cell wall biosynthesis
MNPKNNCRVLMLLENNPYPSDGRVRRESNSLVAAGFEVTVIAPGGWQSPRYENIEGVHVYRFLAPPPGDSLPGYLWEYGWSLFSSFYLTLWVLFRRGFDVIHAHNPPDLFVLIAICYRVIGKKFVFDHHDLSPEMYHSRFRHDEKNMVYRALVFFEKLSCRLADQVIATNESYKKVEIERSRIPAEKITVVRNGPELSRVRTVPPDPELRSKASIILGYVGIMGQQDGVDYFLRALDHLVHGLGRTDVFAVIVGKGDAVPGLKKLATSLGLDSRVWFTGRVPEEDMLRYLSTADICIDPDPYDPFNDRSTMIKMTEYMALGKPIVAFDLTEHRASADDAALYSRHNDVQDFAKNIAILIDNPQLRKKMGAYGRQRIEDSLAWHHQQEKLLQAYENMGFEAAKEPEPIETDSEDACRLDPLEEVGHR